jgi:hypothetical protein
LGAGTQVLTEGNEAPRSQVEHLHARAAVAWGAVLHS